MSFRIPLAPTFSRTRREVLALGEPPEIDIPAEVERALTDAPARLPSSERELWLGTSRAIRGTLVRTGALFLLLALCDAGATLAGMRLLRESRTPAELAVAGTAFFVFNLLSVWQGYVGNRLRNWAGLGAQAYLAGLVSRKLLRLDEAEAARFSQGGLKTLILSDTRAVGTFFDNFTRNAVPALALGAVAVPLMAVVMGWAGLIGLGVMLLMMPFSLAMARVSRRLQNRAQARMDELTSLAGEWVKNVRLIRSLSWQEAFRARIAEGLRRQSRPSVANHFLICLIFGLSFSWWMFSVAGVAVASRWLGGRLDLASFFGAIWIITLLHSLVQHVPNTLRFYTDAAVSMKRILRLLRAAERRERLEASPLRLDGLRPVALELDRVSFEHEPGRPVLNELSLTLALDEKIAVIGVVGSGKTTLLRLLCGDAWPTSGEIRVRFDDGSAHPLRLEPAYDALRDRTAFVPQQPFVASDTLIMNLTLGSPPDGDEARALSLAQLDADLAAFERGTEQEIGEGGVNLSGGQKQRLNLARALRSRRPWLLLDDPLSAVDTRTEARLMDSLLAESAGFVLVSHRTGELLRCQRLLVLAGGRVVEDGEPARLAADRGSHFVRVLEAYDRPEEPAHG